MRPVQRAHDVTQSPFLTFSRSEWARLRGATPMTLSQNDIDEIKDDRGSGPHSALTYWLSLQVKVE
jgi:hypothetical protein